MIEELALADLPKDFEWVVPGFPGTQSARGPEGTLAFFRDWIDQGGPDAILVLVDMRGRGRASGVPVELHFAQVWSFRDGVPVRMVFHTGAEEARRAAGIASPPPEP
jgi:hypothetical protein